MRTRAIYIIHLSDRLSFEGMMVAVRLDSKEIKMRNEAPYNTEYAHLEQQPGINREWKRFNYQFNRAQLIWYNFARQIPDLLTLTRLIMAVILLWSGLIDGQASPGRDIWLLVMGWTTDMADGRIARSLRKERRLVGLRLRWPAALTRRYDVIKGMVADQKTKNTSWLGQHDVYVDMLVSIAVLGYLAVTAMLPLWLPLIYLLVWGVIFLRWGIPEQLAQVFQNPIYAAFVFLSVRSEPAVLPWLLLWAGIALLFFWRRLLQLLKNVFSAVRV